MHFTNLIKFSLLTMTIGLIGQANAQTATIDPLTSEATVARPDANQPVSDSDDATINSSIKSQIAKSDTLSKLDVTVQTTGGVVTLSGMVDSDSQASSLIELAQATIGVHDVKADNLQVKDSQQPFTDMYITARIKGLFIKEKVFGDKDIAALNISVETQNGVVYLTGAIDNQEQLKNAMTLIKSIPGVKSVEYNVKKVTPNTTPETPAPAAAPAPSTNSNPTSY